MSEEGAQPRLDGPAYGEGLPRAWGPPQTALRAPPPMWLAWKLKLLPVTRGSMSDDAGGVRPSGARLDSGGSRGSPRAWEVLGGKGPGRLKGSWALTGGLVEPLVPAGSPTRRD